MAMFAFNRRYNFFSPDYHYGNSIVFPCKLCKKQICAYSRFGKENDAMQHLERYHGDEIKDYDTICPSCIQTHRATPRHKFACSLSHLFPNCEAVTPTGMRFRLFTLQIKREGFFIDGFENKDRIMLYNEEIQVQAREITVVLSILRTVARLNDVRIGGSRKDIDYFKCFAKAYETDGKSFAIIFDKTLFFVYLDVLTEDEVPDTEKSGSVARFLYHSHYDLSDTEFSEDTDTETDSVTESETESDNEL